MEATSAPPRSVSYRIVRAVAFFGIAMILGFVLVKGRVLWTEYRALQREWDADAKGRLIGYPGVTPSFSHAQSPKDWLRDEGDVSYLWAGWDKKAGRHDWFKIGKGEVDRSRLSHQMGKDTIRAIDVPRLESRGGEIWDRIPQDKIVATCEFRGVSLAYPMAVLDKVLIVNDKIHTLPVVVVYTPFVNEVHAVEMFTAALKGKPLSMGHSGYLCDGRPLLYDREGQGLWLPTNEGLKGVAGCGRGQVLSRIANLDPVLWGDWSEKHPEGRLVAGAIRADWKNPKP